MCAKKWLIISIFFKFSLAEVVSGVIRVFPLPVWSLPLNQQLLQHLERTQNRAVRLCRNLSKFDHVSDHYRSQSWLPLQQLIQF